MDDPELGELMETLRDGTEGAATHEILLEVARLLDLWSESLRTGDPALLSSEDARSFVRSRIVEYIDRDPTRPSADTAIWVLGKLYDQDVEPYLANLAARFIDDSRCENHLRQTMIALDNLEVLPTQGLSEFPGDPEAIRQLFVAYLRATTRA